MRRKSEPDKAPAEQVIKDIRRATCRHFSAEDKPASTFSQACRIPLKIFHRVAHDIVGPYLEVQDWPRRATARSQFCYHLTTAYLVSRFDAHGVEVAIARSKAVAVIDLDHQPIGPADFRGEDSTLGGGAHGRAKRTFEIFAGVKSVPAGDLIDIVAESGVLGCADGPSKPCALLQLEQLRT